MVLIQGVHHIELDTLRYRQSSIITKKNMSPFDIHKRASVPSLLPPRARCLVLLFSLALVDLRAKPHFVPKRCCRLGSPWTEWKGSCPQRSGCMVHSHRPLSGTHVCPFQQALIRHVAQFTPSSAVEFLEGSLPAVLVWRRLESTVHSLTSLRLELPGPVSVNHIHMKSTLS